MIFDNLVKVISGIYKHRVLNLQYQFFGKSIAERVFVLRQTIQVQGCYARSCELKSGCNVFGSHEAMCRM